MIDDRIGIIGSTQGVNDNSSPASRNAPATCHRLRDCSTASKAPVDAAGAAGWVAACVAGWATSACDGTSAAVVAAPLGAWASQRAASSGVSTTAFANAPATGSTCTTCCIGG